MFEQAWLITQVCVVYLVRTDYIKYRQRISFLPVALCVREQRNCIGDQSYGRRTEINLNEKLVWKINEGFGQNKKQSVCAQSVNVMISFTLHLSSHRTAWASRPGRSGLRWRNTQWETNSSWCRTSCWGSASSRMRYRCATFNREQLYIV